ncbi:MFS general substrate transporter [Aspergillus ambiguus]|uniref:putative MFS multidrug transporter n=1 Tax=Aspergillus ambiguus TaxID=176160 RepID=UPI003CCE1388
MKQADRELQTRRPYSILTEREKIYNILLCSLVNFLCPVANNIYYPALGPLSRAMHVSRTEINLTITIFKVVQAFTPLLIASYSDRNGRRPVLFACLVIFLASNIGLALQRHYATLLVLRCLQSFGSSSISLLASASVADLVTRAERGKYLFYSSLGVTIGPAIGPIIGGLLIQFLGWRSAFWFLAILTGPIILSTIVFLRETCRAVTGNGSIPPQCWNQSILQLVRRKHQREPDYDSRTVYKRRPSFMDVIKIVGTRHVGLLIICNTIRFSGSMAILSTLPAMLEEKYHYSPLQIGLCYIPYVAGGIATRWTVGTVADWNFRRHAHQHGVDIVQNQQPEIDDVPVEKARLQIAIPLMYFSSIFALGYGWIMNYNVHIAGPLVLLFLFGNTGTGISNSIKMLVIDIHTTRPATATASMNSMKNLVGAGFVAAAMPLIEVIGIGWVGTICAFMWLLVTPPLWILYFKGHEWRKRRGIQD